MPLGTALAVLRHLRAVHLCYRDYTNGITGLALQILKGSIHPVIGLAEATAAWAQSMIVGVYPLYHVGTPCWLVGTDRFA